MLDLIGTFVFGISGGIAGARHRLDLFGILVLSFAAATFGGITRDVVIGAMPPASIQDWRYLGVSILAGLVTFFWSAKISRLQNGVLIFDAAGLGLFAVAGAGKALAFHLGPVPAALLGMLTGIGGGVVRDMLVSEVPAVVMVLGQFWEPSTRRPKKFSALSFGGSFSVAFGSGMSLTDAEREQNIFCSLRCLISGSNPLSLEMMWK